MIAFHRDLIKGESALRSMIWWKSGKLRRQLSSTLAAEAQALLCRLGDLMGPKTFKQDVRSRAEQAIASEKVDSLVCGYGGWNTKPWWWIPSPAERQNNGKKKALMKLLITGLLGLEAEAWQLEVRERRHREGNVRQR